MKGKKLKPEDRKPMTIWSRLHAFMSGRRPYWILDIKKVTFAPSRQACEKAFKGHEKYITQFGFWSKVYAVVTGNYKVSEFKSKSELWQIQIEINREQSVKNHLRVGQIIFNALYDVDPELARKINGTNLDPFHDDNKVGDCIGFVLREWVDRGE